MINSPLIFRGTELGNRFKNLNTIPDVKISLYLEISAERYLSTKNIKTQIDASAVQEQGD